jgi:serine/threonine-protein kinase RsbW
MDYVDDNELRTFLGNVVELRVAADPDHLTLVRLLAECVTARAAFPPAAVIDTTLAVNEAATSLLKHAIAEAWFDCRFTTFDDEISVTIRTVTEKREAPGTQTLGWHLLRELSTSVALRTEPDTTSSGWMTSLQFIMRSGCRPGATG